MNTPAATAGPADFSGHTPVMQQYLAECQQGRIPDRGSLLSEHADVRDELASCLASLDLIQQLAPEIKATVGMGKLSSS